MTYLGTFRIDGPKPLGVRDDGRLDLFDMAPTDPRGFFFAYEAAGGLFQLQSATNGAWLQLVSSQSEKAWYPVLYSAATGPYPTRFATQFLDVAGGSLALNWVNEDGVKVGLYITDGMNPRCNCVFDTTNGWLGRRFGLTSTTPGVPAIRAAKSCAGVTFACHGAACVDLSGADLSGIDASRAVFAGARLDGTSFRGSNLTDADFRGAKLAGTDFRDIDSSQRTTLAGADFSGMDLSSVLFPPPPISRSAGNRVKMAGATVPFLSLHLDWSNLDLSQANIVGLPRDADGRALLNGLVAVGTALRGVQLKNATIRGGLFTGADLAQANMTGADLTSANFAQASLAQAPGFPHAANLSGAMLFNADFTDAQISGAQFIGAYFYGGKATVTGATMRFVKFNDAYLTGLNFSNVRNANMQDANFTGACLVNCRFNGSATQPFEGADASFSRACLHGASFADSTLTGANLLNAAVADKAGALPVTLRINGQPIHFTVNYGPTVLPPAVTTAATICPDGENGPCEGAKLVSPRAPTQWPSLPSRLMTRSRDSRA